MKTRNLQQSEKSVIFKKFILISLCFIATKVMNPSHRPRSNSLPGSTTVVLRVNRCDAAKNHLNSIRESYDREQNCCAGLGGTSVTILAAGILMNPISVKMLCAGSVLGCLTAWLDARIGRDLQVLRTIDASLLQEVAENSNYESSIFQSAVRQELARRRSELVQVVVHEII